MKRDLSLIRELLLIIESAETGRIAPGRLAPHDQQVQYHLRLLYEGGFVRAVGETTGGNISVRLTWQGHELLELARSREVWEFAARQLEKCTSGINVAVLQALLENWSRRTVEVLDWRVDRPADAAEAPAPALSAPPAVPRLSRQEMPFLLHSGAAKRSPVRHAAIQGASGTNGSAGKNGVPYRPSRIRPHHLNGEADALPLYLL